MKVKLAYKSMTMCQKLQPPLFRRSRKGLKMTSAQLLAKKPRFELTLKLKSDMIDEAKKQGFKPDSVQRTLSITEQSSELREQSHRDILNSIDIKESMRIVRSLLHTTSLLSKNDTSSLFTKVYHKCLE